MKRHEILKSTLLVLSIIVAVTTLFAAPAAAQTLAVDSPNGGEAWKAGSSQIIRWKTASKVGNVRITYSTDEGASWRTVALSVRNTGEYSWIVPSTPSKRCLVRIREASDGDPSDVSDEVFTINEGQIE